jgi:hypothetical protein
MGDVLILLESAAPLGKEDVFILGESADPLAMGDVLILVKSAAPLGKEDVLFWLSRPTLWQWEMF